LTGLSDSLSGIQEQRNKLEESLKLLAQLINSASSGFPEIEKKIIAITEQMNNGVKATNDEFKNILLNTIQKTNLEFNKNLEQVNQEINSQVKNLVEKTKEQVVVLDKALSEELTKSLESLGRQMASLSNRFVEDYTPLTEKLRAVLEISRNTA
jgi:F0F1-type ATP synthase membrane subunit b/b'